MASLSAWYDHVLAQVHSCPTALADWAIRQAAIEFCDRSHAHIVDLAAINSVAGTADYNLTPPANHEIVKVIAVEYDGETIDPISPRDVARRYGADWKDEQAEPERFLSQYGTSLKLVPKPDVSITAGIVATVVLRPTDSTTTIDDVIAVPYKGEIAKGARKLLWLMPRKPWTDMKRGEKEEADFIADCASAHIKAQKGRTGAPMRTRNYYYPNR